MTNADMQFRTANWAEFSRKYAPGTSHVGVVGKVEPWGVFVALEDGFDALLHISHVRGLNGLSLPIVFATGQHIPVQIAEVDSEKKRIQLTCDVAALPKTGADYCLSGSNSLAGIVKRMVAFRSFLLTFGFAYDREFINAAKATGKFSEIVGMRFAEFFGGLKLIDILEKPEACAFFSYTWGDETQPTLFIRPNGHVNPGFICVPREEIIEQVRLDIKDLEFEQLDYNALMLKYGARNHAGGAGVIHLACLIAYGRNRGVTKKFTFSHDITHDSSTWRMLPSDDAAGHPSSKFGVNAGLSAAVAGAVAGVGAVVAAPLVAAAGLGGVTAGVTAALFNRKRQPKPMVKVPTDDDKLLLIDGTNLLQRFKDKGYTAKTILLAIKAIQNRGWRYHVFFDCSIEPILETTNDQTIVRLINDLKASKDCAMTIVPAGTPADEYLLMYADVKGVDVVSNDLFRDYSERFPWVGQKVEEGKRIHSCAYVLDQFMIPTLGLCVPIDSV